MKYGNLILIGVAVCLIAVLIMADNFILKITAFVFLLLVVSILFYLLDRDKKIFPLNVTGGAEDDMPVPSSKVENSIKENTAPDTDLDKLDEGFKIVGRGTAKVLTDHNIGSIGNRQGSTSSADSDEYIQKFKNLATEAFPDELAAKQQLSFLIEKLLIIVRELFSAHTAIFFWYDKKKSTLSIENYSSNSSDLKKIKLEVQEDVLGRIIKEEVPGLLSDVPSITEQDNFRYYNSPQKIKSFLGVPVFHDSTLVGILAVDSKSPDAFGIEQMYTLGRFVRLITVLIDLFAQKHSESIAQKRVEGFGDFLNDINAVSDDAVLHKSIANMASKMVDSDCFTLITYNADEHKYKVAAVNNPHSFSYISEGEVIDTETSLAGKSIFSGSQIKISEMGNIPVCRFKTDENIVLDGSFLITPIIFNREVLGLLCYETLKKSSFSGKDVDYLLKIATMLGVVLHYFNGTRHLRKLVIFDPDSGFYSKSFFQTRVSEELEKAKILGLTSNVIMIKIDETRHREDLSDYSNIKPIMEQMAVALSEENDPLSFWGRIDELAFGLFVLNRNQEELGILADKTRLKISRTPVHVNSRSTTFTASIGVVSTNGKTDIQQIMQDLRLACKKASDTGGNRVLQL